MKNFNNEDKKWIENCKNNPNRYKIYVDNDNIFVVNITKNEEEYMHTFQCWGYDFIVQILNHLKINADWV